MNQALQLLRTPEAPSQDRVFEPMSCVCVGADGPGSRHVVHSHHDGVVAFLCMRWQPEEKVARVEDRRRHSNVCYHCYKAWERLHCKGRCA